MILYSDEHKKICTLSGYKDRCITSTLKTGDKEMTFKFRQNYKYADRMKEEAYIRTKTDEFVIKEIIPSDDWYTCTATLNVEELEGKQFPTGFVSETQTAKGCIEQAIANTGWTVSLCEIKKKRTISKDNSCSAWDIIQSVITTYRCEIAFDTLQKQIVIYEKMGKDSGAYFMERLNIKKLEIQTNTYDFATRLIPIGKDGLMISLNGNNYIDNHQYSSKVKAITWKDERYTDVESLLEDAKAKLEDISKPYESYTVDIKDLASAHPEKYGDILAFGLGDTVMLISKSKKLRESHRIVKMYEYPESTDNNKVEMANTRLSFEEIQKQEQELNG